jgi:two-component system chemotaxis response regulator CheB
VEVAVSAQSRHVHQRDLVVIGASAGGVDALQELVRGLPPEFPAAVLVVLHVASSGTSVLPQILSRKGALPAAFAEDGEELRRGQIYVAPADNHMLVHDGRIRLTKGPRENGHRPAIDPLFRSAARMARERCIGVILSGLLDDGASGMRLIKASHGATVVQDPEDAQFPSMPRAAMAMADIDAVTPATGIAERLCQLIEQRVDPPPDSTRELRAVDADGTPDNLDRVEVEDPSETRMLLEGPPTSLTCPECGGSLWEREDGPEIRFACHVGHAYSPGSLVEEQGRALETTLWSAVRALEERADMNRRLARRTGGPRRVQYEERGTEADAHARALRGMLGEAGRLAVAAGDQS